jgi:hypothetical protein
MDINDDPKLLQDCIDHLEKHHSIDVQKLLIQYKDAYANHQEFYAAKNRTRYSILRNKKYMESTEEAQDGTRRIMFNPNYNEESEGLITRKLRADTANAERVYKSYPYTQFAAWFSFFVMLILGFLKIAEATHIWPYRK